MLKGGTNYTMIRRAIFGKVHGHGVNEIWLTSNFPPNILVWLVAPRLCSLVPVWLDFWDTVMEL